MNYKMDALDKALAQQQMIQQGKEIREAQQAARQRTGGKPEIDPDLPRDTQKKLAFQAGFGATEQQQSPGKADPNLNKADRFAAGFGGKDRPTEPTLLEKLMAYSERHAAPQQAPEAPAAVVEPSPQGRRAEAAEAQQGQQQGAEQLPLPLSTAGLFSALEQKVGALTSKPVMPADVQVRNAYRNLPGDIRERILRKVEIESYGLEGHLSRQTPDYAALLVGADLFKRYQDAQRLDPEITVDRLLEMMAQG